MHKIAYPISLQYPSRSYHQHDIVTCHHELICSVAIVYEFEHVIYAKYEQYYVHTLENEINKSLMQGGQKDKGFKTIDTKKKTDE